MPVTRAETAGGLVRTLTYTASGNTASDDDGAGTVLTKLYDSTDRLAEVKNGAATVAAYLHNAGGQRVAKTVGAAVTHYLYDLGGRLIAEADGGTGATQAEYVWLDGIPLAYIQGGAVYFVHPDHLGTPQRVTDAVAAVVWDADYRPFGEATVTGALTFNLRFPGQYYDAETGLYYNYFRDYDPATGRYIQSDPIGLQGGWNTYGYVFGNPVMWLDPAGLAAMCRPGPTYAPGLWNDGGKVQRSNNCYSYALNKPDNPGMSSKPQPGEYSGAPFSRLDCISIMVAALRDGLRTPDAGGNCPECYYKVYLVIAPGKDYHWYRRDSDGSWSHKPGHTKATNRDASGDKITNPANADRNYGYLNYSIDCGVLCAKNR